MGIDTFIIDCENLNSALDELAKIDVCRGLIFGKVHSYRGSRYNPFLEELVGKEFDIDEKVTKEEVKEIEIALKKFIDEQFPEHKDIKTDQPIVGTLAEKKENYKKIVEDLSKKTGKEYEKHNYPDDIVTNLARGCGGMFDYGKKVHDDITIFEIVELHKFFDVCVRYGFELEHF